MAHVATVGGQRFGDPVVARAGERHGRDGHVLRVSRSSAAACMSGGDLGQHGVARGDTADGVDEVGDGGALVDERVGSGDPRRDGERRPA